MRSINRAADWALSKIVPGRTAQASSGCAWQSYCSGAALYKKYCCCTVSGGYYCQTPVLVSRTGCA